MYGSGRCNEHHPRLAIIWLGGEWSTCKAQLEFYINAAVFVEKRHSGFACIHLPISDTG